MQFQQSQRLKMLLETKVCHRVCEQSRGQVYDLLTVMVEIIRTRFFDYDVQDTDES